MDALGAFLVWSKLTKLEETAQLCKRFSCRCQIMATNAPKSSIYIVRIFMNQSLVTTMYCIFQGHYFLRYLCLSMPD